MDHIEVRQLRFDFDRLQGRDPVWSRSSPDFARFINALGIHVPYFERFLVTVMRNYRDELASDSLKADVQAIIGQESHHAFNFIRWTEHLVRQYPPIARLDQHAEQYFNAALKNRSRKFQIGFTAGYETFTFLGGMIILNRYTELMADADPDLRALWVWHQVEEVEHGAVAFDFYRAFYPTEEWYRRWMVLYAFGHIANETFKAYRVMLNGEQPGLRNRLRSWKFFAGFASNLFTAALPVFGRRYHPRNHPICNDRQSPIAMGWREYVGQGHDARMLDETAMQQITAYEAEH